MKAPSFWYNKPGLVSTLLSPLSLFYTKAGRKHRLNANPAKLSIPVICIGNIVSGGSGKTPTALALLALLQSSKIALSPFFLTRGYRGKVEGPERVDDSHDPDLWGDEALLLSRHASTIVSKNRYAGGILAQDLQADMIIMDDGMQNYTLSKDVTFCVIDGKTGFGNGEVIPGGPLRQPLEDGYALSDAFIVIGTDENNTISALPKGKPVFKADMNVKAGQSFKTSAEYMAFCGIGFPEKFRATLEKSGLKVKEFRSFGDHYTYTPKDIAALVNDAEKQNLKLITTEKDFARLPDFAEKRQIDILAVEIVFQSPDDVTAFIRKKISA